MTQPDNFGIDLATRIALHEILLEKLFYDVLKDHPNREQALQTLRGSLTASFEPSALNAGGPGSAEQRAFVEQQGAWGKELSERFVRKIERMF